MADKKKAYRRFEELTKRAMAPGSQAEADGSSTDQRAGGERTAGPPPEEVVLLLSPEVRHALDLRAAADKTTPSDVAEAALRRYLEMRRSRFS